MSRFHQRLREDLKDPEFAAAFYHMCERIVSHPQKRNQFMLRLSLFLHNAFRSIKSACGQSPLR
jgi:hypothetical protein